MSLQIQVVDPQGEDALGLRVAAGEQEFVYINEHFLKDYDTEVNNRASKISAPQFPQPQEASKSWWQFWKQTSR